MKTVPEKGTSREAIPEGGALATETVKDLRFMRLFVATAARDAKFPSSRPEKSPFIAVSASQAMARALEATDSREEAAKGPDSRTKECLTQSAPLAEEGLSFLSGRPEKSPSTAMIVLIREAALQSRVLIRDIKNSSMF